MMFCPKCGSLLKPATKKGKTIMACSCGFSDMDTDKAKLKEEFKEENKIEVVEKEAEALPLVDATCEKCGHKKAYFWSVQTRAGDEPETRFFKCEKCKHTWREYK
ncbi:transcription factor S [Candidatus Woesearchaeota archaeon]|nr:MAG: transcription factor S [Candidatus Woesearchaeota archaeon]